jgi:hypothetical protein
MSVGRQAKSCRCYLPTCEKLELREKEAFGRYKQSVRERASHKFYVIAVWVRMMV